MTKEELRAREEVEGLSDATLTLVRGRFRDHLSVVKNFDGKKKDEAVEDFLHDFKRLGLA